MLVPTIKSKQFTLRPYRSGDEKSLRRNINTKRIYDYTLHIPHPYTSRHARDWVRKKVFQKGKKQVDELSFAIDINGEVVGGVGLQNMEKHKAEIGYWLGENYWGNG